MSRPAGPGEGPPCGDPGCPVPDPATIDLRRLRSITWDRDDSPLWRSMRADADPAALVDGHGDTRFAPLAGTAHVYLARNRATALLETTFHEAAGPDPTIYRHQLRDRQVAPVALRSPVRLVDLRDAQLERLGLTRTQLVDTTARHYPCTRRWAAALQLRHVGGRPVAGCVWHSRQADLHRRANAGGLAADLLVHRPVEVAVLWHPAGPSRPLRRAGDPEPLLVDGDPARIVVELSALIGAPIF